MMTLAAVWPCTAWLAWDGEPGEGARQAHWNLGISWSDVPMMWLLSPHYPWPAGQSAP